MIKNLKSFEVHDLLARNLTLTENPEWRVNRAQMHFFGCLDVEWPLAEYKTGQGKGFILKIHGDARTQTRLFLDVNLRCFHT